MASKGESRWSTYTEKELEEKVRKLRQKRERYESKRKTIQDQLDQTDKDIQEIERDLKIVNHLRGIGESMERIDGYMSDIKDLGEGKQ